ncbi:MAG: hypothetical protein LBQ75_07865, partial [Zoogloeaceae bacterium]|nr:hypothetical protein [Zoogloeaceae bacterium]
KILLIGRNDRFVERGSAGQTRPTIPEIIADVPEEDRDAVKILLDHQPFNLGAAEEAGVFLQLSGHTHNGQLLPFNLVVVMLFENSHGYSRRGQTHYWVSSGVGSWGARIRTTGRPEIVLIDLVPEG